MENEPIPYHKGLQILYFPEQLKAQKLLKMNVIYFLESMENRLELLLSRMHLKTGI